MQRGIDPDRATAGLMLTHGIPKLQRLLSGEEIKFADPYGLGPEVSFVLVIFAEFLCSILVALGLATRLAVIPLMITMATAIVSVLTGIPIKDMLREGWLFLLMLVALLLLVTYVPAFSLWLPGLMK